MFSGAWLALPSSSIRLGFREMVAGEDTVWLTRILAACPRILVTEWSTQYQLYRPFGPINCDDCTSAWARIDVGVARRVCQLIMEVDFECKIEPLAELIGSLSRFPTKKYAYFCIGHTEVAWHIAWNPTKPLLASCSADKSVQIYSYTSSNPPNFTLATTIATEHSRTVRAVAWAPSGDTLATASFDSNIGIWERAREGDEEDGQSPQGEWECVSTLEGHETECKSVAYSCTGTLLASCSRDKTVWIWEGAFHPGSYSFFTVC